MNMTLHHQKHARLTDGVFVNVGEDGKPYADNELLIIADGLGGRGGFPHTKINPDVFNEQFFYETFIEPVVKLDDESYARNEAYVCFVMNSFRELFELKGKYFANTANMRTSGYFASRLVTAIVLHAFKLNPQFDKDRIFSEIEKLEDEEQKQYIGSLGESLAELIRVQLARAAELMGLELESKTKGSYLLPTTLAVALINEKEDGAQVLYFWAGDSRGYLWDENGLAQLTDDHERNETMFNLITLTKPFRIETRLVSVSKPAILFNATDGCYKCPCYASPFDMEYVFLQAIEASEDFGGVSQFLDRQFSVIGTHDDSNTKALTTLGFESFEMVKAAAAQRMEYIQENIIKVLPDILERDYEGELLRMDEQIDGDIYSVRGDIIKDENIIEFVKNKMISDGYSPYVKEKESLHKQIEEFDAEEGELREKVINWVRKNWIRALRLKKYSSAKYDLNRGDTYEKFEQLEACIGEEMQRYSDTCNRLFDNLNACVSALNNMRNDVLNIYALSDRELRKKLSHKIGDVRDQLKSLDRNMANDKADNIYSNYYKYDVELKKTCEFYEKQDAKKIEEFADDLISGEIILGRLPVARNAFNKISPYLAELSDIARLKRELNAQLVGLEDKYYLSYWNSLSYDLVVLIFREHRDIIPEQILSMVANHIEELRAEREKISEGKQIRDQLYDKYAEGYYRYFEESKL